MTASIRDVALGQLNEDIRGLELQRAQLRHELKKLEEDLSELYQARRGRVEWSGNIPRAAWCAQCGQHPVQAAEGQTLCTHCGGQHG